MPDQRCITTEMPRLEAVYVAVDGSIKAVYHDNTLLIMSADGSSFTHVSPAGAKTVQLCEFCLSRSAPLLTELLDFRNQHVDVPAVSRPLLQQLQRSSQTFTLHFPITYTCWTATAAEAFQQGLVELPDSTRIAVLSKCGYARIMLEYTGLRFAVRYPLLVAHDPASSSYTYTWQLQVFSRSQYPARWQPALAVAWAVADCAAHGFRLHGSQQHQQPQQQLPRPFADLTNQHSSCGHLAAPVQC
ncbi:hypothetical protein COO60DRAFT_404431 [Scenedesmus sp. NREL 46B-D3]|nr:hypothetical protein COO60DRAFT_404431 [Scenedesmus sp. NREL 46B-D3]